MAEKKQKMDGTAATCEGQEERQPVEKKRLTSFFVRPSIHDPFKRLASYRGMSVGALLDSLMADYLEEHRDELGAYDEVAKMAQAKTVKDD